MSRAAVPALRAARLTRRLPFAALLLSAAAASAANLGVKLPAALPLAGPTVTTPAVPVLTPPQSVSGPGLALSLSVPDISALERKSPERVGAAIAESKSVDQALANVVKTGALAPERVPQDPTDRLFLLKRLWDHAAPAYAEGKIAVDAGWAVPALRVERAGTTYLIHPVAHGQVYPPNKRAVSRLVEQVRGRGEALYSEQGLPAHYAFSYGRETADHAVDEGAPIRVGPAADGLPAGALKAFHAASAAVALAPLAAAAPHLLAHPTAAAIVAAALYAAFLGLLRSGLLPYYRFLAWQRARQAAALGAPELAEQLSREAAALHRARLDPLEVLRLHLPPGPGASSDPFAARSAAMAQAVAEDAAKASARDGGANVVHLLVGYRHAADIGWRLRSQLP